MTKQTRQEQTTEKSRYWQAHMKGWRQSGISQAGYCRRQNLNLKTFSYWRRKLRPKGPTVKLIQVQPEKLFSVKDAEERVPELKVTIDGRFGIEVREGFNPDTLRQVIETLRLM